MDGLYPLHPGSKAEGTSADAANAMGSRAPKLRDRVLAALRAQPLTADECAAALGETVLAVRPRLSELRKLNLISDTGIRRKNVSGTNAVVWCAAQDGVVSLGEAAANVVTAVAQKMNRREI